LRRADHSSKGVLPCVKIDYEISVCEAAKDLSRTVEPLMMMARAVSRRLLIAEVWVRARVSSCEINDGQSGTGTGFSPSSSVFH
jgi:hypothetical protein